MIVKIELSPDTQRRMAEMSQMGRRISAAIRAGLERGTKAAAGHVSAEYLSGQALKSRTGLLRKAVSAWMVADDQAMVGVQDNAGVEKYKWLLGGERKTIRPMRGRFLAIPIGENLTAAGVARYNSPRDVPNGFFIHSGGKLLFGHRLGKTAKAKFRPLFVLVSSVTIKGSDALAKGVLDCRDDIAAAMNEQIDKATAQC